MSKQLSLLDPLDFEDGSSLPIPLRAAKHFGFPLQYHDEMYALQDWVAGLTGLSGVQLRKEIGRAKSVVTQMGTTDNAGNSTVTRMGTVEKMPYRSTDGKTYKVPFADSRALWRIVAYLYQTSDRPILAEMKDFLASAGVLVEQIAAEPLRAAERIKGIVSRKAFTAALIEVVTNLPPTGIGTATNDVYRGVFHRDTNQLKQELQTSNPRDKLSHIALSYLGIAEWICSQRLGDAQEVTFADARLIIQDVSGMIGAQADEVESRMGIDVVTGHRLLGPIDAIRGLPEVLQ